MSFHEGKQRRFLAAATTKKRAVELLNVARAGWVSRHYFDGWWSETGNAVELSVATEEGVWVCTADRGFRNPEDYVRLK